MQRLRCLQSQQNDSLEAWHQCRRILEFWRPSSGTSKRVCHREFWRCAVCYSTWSKTSDGEGKVVEPWLQLRMGFSGYQRWLSTTTVEINKIVQRQLKNKIWLNNKCDKRLTNFNKETFYSKSNIFFTKYYSFTTLVEKMPMWNNRLYSRWSCHGI